ncbi:GIY-YIG nuclease family protein, partial [Polynucleobacter rarus]|uniref:GIY-YIG nuclease family protein n=1 Tax=Polynucleobacter rarus TaxID=556055 RepID=UPI0014738CF8
MADAYTIKIHVLNGDPEGVRIIDRMNWTGQGIAFPREEWQNIKNLKEFSSPGIYILVGHPSDDDDLPTLYIGEGDGIGNRIESHAKNKEFWSWGIAFVSTNNSLNKAHAQWLEYALISRAKEINRCKLDNSNSPQAPILSLSDKSDTK